MRKLAGRDYLTLISSGSTYNKNLITGESERLFSSRSYPSGTNSFGRNSFCFSHSIIFYSSPSLAIIILSITLLIGYPLGSLLLPKFLSWGDSFRESEIKNFKV